jgi:aminoglycoside 6'-N-acetyltransferase I
MSHNSAEKDNSKIRHLNKTEKIPYDLLLLADETVYAINKYIFNSELYILEQEEKIIAIYVLLPLSVDEIEIKNIAVLEEYQGQGIGKILLEDAEKRSRERGFRKLLIGTADIATKQLHVYQKAGFEIFERKKNYFIEHYPEPIYENGTQLKDMVLLRKIL